MCSCSELANRDRRARPAVGTGRCDRSRELRCFWLRCRSGVRQCPPQEPHSRPQRRRDEFGLWSPVQLRIGACVTRPRRPERSAERAAAAWRDSRSLSRACVAALHPAPNTPITITPAESACVSAAPQLCFQPAGAQQECSFTGSYGHTSAFITAQMKLHGPSQVAAPPNTKDCTAATRAAGGGAYAGNTVRGAFVHAHSAPN